MRALVPPFAALAIALSAYAPAVAADAPPVVEARMSLEGLRAEGKVALEAGAYGENDPYQIGFDFESDGETLGKPKGVGLQLKFGAYCRDRDSWVEAVLIAPSGRRWPAHRVAVPPGPDRLQDWSSGYLKAPALLKAVEAGGRFTLALKDDEGKLWNAVVIDTLAPADRERLLAAGGAAPPATPSETGSAADDGMIEVIAQDPKALPSPPRRCPAP